MNGENEADSSMRGMDQVIDKSKAVTVGDKDGYVREALDRLCECVAFGPGSLQG